MTLQEENQKLYLLGYLAIPVFLAGAFLCIHVFPAVFPFGCGWRWLFGIYCPGCGATRAMKALLAGDLIQAVRYYPPSAYLLGYYILFMGSNTLERLHVKGCKGILFRPLHLYILLFLLVVNCIIKNM